jgi:hypothetical protein
LPDLVLFPEDAHANQIRLWLASSHFFQPPAALAAADHPLLCEIPGALSKSFPA